MKTYYELLEVSRTASPDEIKRAFRREIAKYHPDKVQHLGAEFQEIAVNKAAELTQAYKTLSDPAARADYDAMLDEGAPAPSGGPAAAPHAPAATRDPAPERTAARPESPRPPAPDASPSGGSSFFAHERAGAMDLVRRATLARFRQAMDQEFGGWEPRNLPGFDVTCLPKPGFWSRRSPPAILGRFVPQVDAAAVSETWAMAAKMRNDPQRDLCVFLMGPTVSAAGELAGAIAQQRRKPMPAGIKVVMIPINTNTWHAHVPTDAPPVVKSVLTRLKSA